MFPRIKLKSLLALSPALFVIGVVSRWLFPVARVVVPYPATFAEAIRVSWANRVGFLADLCVVLTYLLGPVLIREVAYRTVRFWAARRPRLPWRRTIPLAGDLRAIAFPGLGADWRQTLIPRGQWPNAVTLLPCPVTACEAYENGTFWPDPSVPLYVPFAVNVAQQDDVEHALAFVRKEMAIYPDKRFILFGSSRGSAVALQVAARLAPAEAKHIGLVVCEGLFTNVEDVIDTRFHWALTRFLVRFFLALFTTYNPANNNVWSPLAAAETFAHRDLPILVVSSAADTVVVPSLGVRVYDALRRRGVLTARHGELKSSPHSAYAWHNDEDRRGYVKELNFMYTKYGLASPV